MLSHMKKALNTLLDFPGYMPMKHFQMEHRDLVPLLLLFNVCHEFPEFIEGFESLTRCHGIRINAFQ